MTTLIKNGLVYDGTGTAPVKKDILIRGERIAKCGTISRTHAETVIDATGAAITPGFIDINAHSDHYMSLFYEPHQEDFVRQGITTIIGGNCGVSLAPLVDGSLRTIHEWGNETHTNVNWTSVKQFYAMLKRRGLGINFGMLAGHTTIREAITRGKFRDLTESEIRLFKHVLARAMKDGALGLSTGLGHTHAERTPHHELVELAKVIATHKGVYATHLRDVRDELLASIEETIMLASETGANVQILHLQPLKSHREQYTEAARMIQKESARLHINFDVNPFDTATMLVYELLPNWFREERLETMHTNIKVPHARERLIAHFKATAPRDCMLAHIPHPSLKFLEGRSIREFGARSGISYEEAILKIMDITNLRATISAKIVDAELRDAYIAHPNSFIATNSASFSKKEFKYIPSTDTYPALLRMAAESETIRTEHAIEKSTSLPAKKYGIAKRGEIREGNFADIVVHENFRPAHVFVNGTRVLDGGELVKHLRGAIIKRA